MIRSKKEPSRGAARSRWPLWPLVVAALIGLIPGLAGLFLALQSRHEDPASAIAALRNDLGRLSARLDAVEKRPDAGPLRDAAASLDKRIATVETLARGAQSVANKAAGDAAAAAATAATAQTATSRSSAEAQLAPPTDLSPLRQRIGEVDTRVGDLDQRLASLDTRLGVLQAKLDAPKIDTRASTADKETDSESANGAAAVAVVAESLSQALTRGAPFATELAALKGLKADPTKVAALEPHAATGAPTARVLAERFRPLGVEIAKEDAPREGSFFDRIKQSASRLVSVRPVGEKQGSDPAALASQIQAALDRGDLARAHDLWTKLPERAKTLSQDWARSLEGRLAADAAARSVATDAIARLARSRS
ncbi:MAG: hypothetical protein NVSMB26_23370 [Beijerinckiaceae bacterium]